MIENFMLGFGGTGARCLEAITYLQAAGCLEQDLHVLLVDPDVSNGNVTIARNQLQRVHRLQRALDPASTRVPYFRDRVNPNHDTDSFFWEYPAGQQHSFSSQIEYSSRPEDERDLLGLLYDRDDLNLTFENGYVGRAHIGSLDLLGTLEGALAPFWDEEAEIPEQALHKFVRSLRSAAQSQRARLLVVGSNFGGTGASGLPAVPPLVRRALAEVSEGITMGCVQLAPYFSFPSGGDQAPDSALHPLATRASLYHYAYTDVGYDRMYLVGAPNRAETAEDNDPGGTDQRNDAHYAEVGAALAAVDYFRDPPEPGQVEVSACGSTGTSWTDLPSSDDIELRKRLVSLGTLCLAHGRFFHEDLVHGRHEGFPWRVRLSSDPGRELGGREKNLEELREFSVRFLDWADQVEESTPARLFGPDLTEAEPAGRVLGQVTAGGRSGGDPFHELLAALNRVSDVQQSSGDGWYLEALGRAAKEFCASHYQAWWSTDG